MEKRELIICRGIQGSGKSTWAKQWAKEQPETRIRINFDDMRNMLGEYWVPSRETVISSIYTTTLAYAMEKGYSIVVDNMNLNPKTCAELEKIVKDFNDDTVCKFEYEVEYKDFFIPVEECIRRDAMRPNPIGAAIIKSTFKRYRDLITSEELKALRSKRVPYIDGAQNAIIVDIDGTLCLRVNDRPWFGKGAAEGMLHDERIMGTCSIVQNMYNKCKIIVLTGREESPEVVKATQGWLLMNNIKYDQLYFRPQGNYDTAAKCKKEIYDTHIKGKYNVLFALEDNNKCVEMWRNEGLTCLQPNEGKF